MISIQLNNASNGVIKKVIDTQYNGADQIAEITTVYEFDEEDKFEYFVKLISLLHDVSKDLGFDFGSDFEQIQLKFELDWGDKYNPTVEEIDDRLKDLREEIKDLKELKKLVLENDVN